MLLRLQLVHPPEELLEQFAPFWADALLEPIHYFIGRKLRSNAPASPTSHLITFDSATIPPKYAYGYFSARTSSTLGPCTANAAPDPLGRPLIGS